MKNLILFLFIIGGCGALLGVGLCFAYIGYFFLGLNIAFCTLFAGPVWSLILGTILYWLWCCLVILFLFWIFSSDKSKSSTASTTEKADQ